MLALALGVAIAVGSGFTTWAKSSANRRWFCEDAYAGLRAAGRMECAEPGTTSRKRTLEHAVPPSSDPLFPVRGLRPRWAARRRARGAVYARFSTRFQHSLEDQIRTCRDWAAAHDVEVDDEHVFTDAGKTGKSCRRPGIDAMMAALKAGKIDVVITFATNRLHRKIHLALKFVEEEIVEKRRRCVFVAQNLDTANTEFWKALVYVFAMLDELQVTMSAGHIRAAHIGLVLKRIITGTLTFGYTGVPIPGEITKRGKPRRRWEINPETAKWVPRIFEWFLKREMQFAAIARKLRHKNVPPPPKVARWSWRSVKYLLMNRRYIGDWSYGWRETVWQSKGDYARQFPKEKPTHEHREECLRLIEDTIFFAAQERIAIKAGRGGRPTHTGQRIRDLILAVGWCPKHKRFVSAQGAQSHLAGCPECKRAPEGEQDLYSLINRRHARRLICQELARHIRADETLIEQAIACARQHIERLQNPDPRQIDRLNRELEALNSRIAFVLDNPGDSQTDQKENAARLASLRAQRGGIERQIAEHKRLLAARPELPTAQELKSLVEDMAGILDGAAKSDDPEVLEAAIDVVRDLTGGKIELSQQGHRQPKCGWLRGTFRLQLLRTTLGRADCALPEYSEPGDVITIDFVEPSPAEALADEAKALWDQKFLIKEIARKLSERRGEPVSRNLVTLAIRHWFESRGLPVPDGRARRTELQNKSVDPTLHRTIAQQVMELVNEDLLLVEIAQQLGVDKNTVTAAIRYWHESRGLPVPDGRSRRKTLDRKSRTEPPANTPSA